MSVPDNGMDPRPWSYYPTPPSVWAPVPAPPPSISPWIIVLVVVSSLALLVGMTATGIGVLALVGQPSSGWVPGDGGWGADESFGDAEYGDYAGTSGVAGVTSVVELSPGTCFSVAGFDADYVGDASAVSCDDPHDYEVYAAERLAGDEFPGYDALVAQVYTTCDGEFADYVGVDYLDSTAEYGGFAPTEQGWSDGKREIVCFAFVYVTERTGSLRGSGA